MNSMTKISLIVVLLLLSGCGVISDADEKIIFKQHREPQALELQFLDLARYLDSAKPCYLIHPQSLVKAPFNPDGSRVSFVRSTCFRDVAFHAGDDSLCQKVRSVSTLLLSGAELNEKNCRETATGYGRVSNNLNVQKILMLAGYSESDVDASLVVAGRFSTATEALQSRQQSLVHYWAEVRETVLHSREFFERIDELPGFADSRDRTDMAAISWQPRLFAD